MKIPSHFRTKLLLFALFCGVLLLWVVMDWPCIFRAVTGIPCIGCGLSRAWLAALRLDFAAAFRYHPMFWSIPILFLMAMWDGCLFPRALWNHLLAGGVTAGFFVCYLIRIVGYLRGEIVF